MIFFGASAIGTSEMDEHHKKLIGLYGDNIGENYFPYEGSTTWPPPTTVTRPIEFADVPTFSFDMKTHTTKIPSNIPLNSISYVIPQANYMFRGGIESYISSAANISRYRLRENVRACTLKFLKGIGYQGMIDSPYRGIPSAAGCALSGLTENSRQTIMSISPEFGSTVGLYDMLTDLPLAPTKPIDAGLWRFCQTCGICATHCPTGAIEPKGGREPSWEPYPSATKPMHPELPGLGFSPVGAGESEYFKTGRKTYWNDMIACRYGQRANFPANGCRICYGSCVFNSQQGPMVHDVVRATLATTSVFNSFFATMDTTFGFGPKLDEKIEDWWDAQLPAYGYSTLVGARHGGYK
jgi:reductive dehalogenase